jgi:hypothetical protein
MILQVPLDEKGPDKRVFFNGYWLTLDEIDMKRRYNARVNAVRTSYKQAEDHDGNERERERRCSHRAEMTGFGTASAGLPMP